MPQDAFTLRYVCKELNAAFVGGKISKINQPEKDLLSLLIYTQKGTVKLDIDLSAKFCRASAGESTEFTNPKTAPNFCMLLRKHLQNAEITNVEQAGFERVLYFDLKCFSEFETTSMRLYLEIMGKYSNAVLTKNGIIVGALKTASLETGARRVTLSGAVYRPPEKQDKADPTDLAQIKETFKTKCGGAAEFISGRIAGIAYTTAADMVETYGENITAENVYEYVNSPNCQPCVAVKDGEPYDFKARAVKDGKPRESLLKAQAEYYSYAVNKKKFQDGKRKLLSAVAAAEKKVEKRLVAALDKLEECASAETVKLKGELITANIYAVQRGMSELEAVNYYDENGEKIKIALDKTLSPADNAQRYYKKYAKLKRTLISVTEQKREAEAQKSYLNSINSHICAAESVCDLEETEEELKALGLIRAVESGKKSVVKQTPFREFVCGGFKILAGRSNLQNDRLLKSASPQDIWLHTQGYHSSHVIISSRGEAVPDSVLQAAAEICAYYSDGRNGSKIPVDYCQRRFVKKPPRSNAGYVVYTDYKTTLAVPDAHGELAASNQKTGQ